MLFGTIYSLAVPEPPNIDAVFFVSKWVYIYQVVLLAVICYSCASWCEEMAEYDEPISDDEKVT